MSATETILDAEEYIFTLVNQARIARYMMQDIMEKFFERVEIGTDEEKMRKCFC